MSEYGPAREATDFDFRRYYGDEREVVYSAAGLRNLVYAESAAYEITPVDVREYVGEFTEDETTAMLLHRSNTDTAAVEAVRHLESALLESGQKAFTIMDNHPESQCSIDELKHKIETHTKYLETPGLGLDAAEIAETKAKTARLKLVLKDRERRIRLFDTHFYNVNRQRNGWPLKAAIEGIAKHRAAQAASSDETPASTE